jgi:hypothetical protein
MQPEEIPSLEASAADGEAAPSPSLGEDILPEPSADIGLESSKNQVNKPQESDEIFLPTPAASDSAYSAPVGSPSSRVYSDDIDWRSAGTQRPGFSIYAGTGLKSYPTALVLADRTMGISVGASVRMLSLAQTIFIHIYAGYSWYSVGDVGTAPYGMSQVKDETMHVGGLLEVGVGRRFSLFGSLLRRQARVSATSTASDPVTGLQIRQDPIALRDIGEEGTLHLGLGAQWDFYVIPHGSIGVHGQIEQDLVMITLAVAMEPAPRKKLSLNLNEPY